MGDLVIQQRPKRDVIPAKAGTHPEMRRLLRKDLTTSGWAPACAGVTPWMRKHLRQGLSPSLAHTGLRQDDAGAGRIDREVVEAAGATTTPTKWSGPPLGDGPAVGARRRQREKDAAPASSYQSAISSGGLAVSPHHFL